MRHRSPSVRPRPAAVLALVVALLAGLLAAAPARADADVEVVVSGTVTDHRGAPLRTGTVVDFVLQKQTDGGWEEYSIGTFFDLPGFDLTVREPGRYRIRAVPESGYLGAYSDEFAVEESSGPISGLHIALQRRGRITGTVSAPGLSNVELGGSIMLETYATERDDDGTEIGWSVVDDGEVASDGTYELELAYGGRYRLHAHGKRYRGVSGEFTLTDEEALEDRTVNLAAQRAALITGAIAVRGAEDATLRVRVEERRAGRWTLVDSTYVRSREPYKLWTWSTGRMRLYYRVFSPRGDRSQRIYWNGTPSGTTRASHAREFTIPHGGVRSGWNMRVRDSGQLIKNRTKLGLRAKGAKRKAKLTVVVSADRVPASRITGKVAVFFRNKRLKVVPVRKGRATIVVTKLKRGKRVFEVRYLGTDIMTRDKRKVAVQVR